MGKIKTELFEEKQQAMSDNELIELVQKEISKLAKKRGKSHTMCVPPMITDTDMLLSEMVRRFKECALTDSSSVPQANELSPNVRAMLPDLETVKLAIEQYRKKKTIDGWYTGIDGVGYHFRDGINWALNYLSSKGNLR